LARVGVFFSEKFKGRSWPIIGDRFRDFPEAFGELLNHPDFTLYEPKPVSEELLAKVHSRRLLETVRAAWHYEGARLTVGACVEALEKIWTGEINSAVVLSVAAGHHAGPDNAWGGTYLSSFGPAILNLKEKHGVRRFAILDTDSHHADGDRAMFRGNPNILHVCFCGFNRVEEGGLKVDVDVGWRTTDEAYLKLVEEEFLRRAEAFKPEAVLHSLGYDTCQGDYGDRGLTPAFFPRLVAKVKAFTDRVCGGRYLIAIMGGSNPQTASLIIPEMVRVLLS